jgi:hypothetical protein
VRFILIILLFVSCTPVKPCGHKHPKEIKFKGFL